MIPSTQNLISPFDVSTFGKQLLPLINVNIKEKVKDFARTFNSGADYIEDAIRDSWKESPLNPHNFKHLLETPNLFKQLPFTPAVRKPIHAPTSHRGSKAHNHKEKAPKAIEAYSVDGLMHDYGINGYKHFEESILRELEKQEELKVEATIHTLFEHGDRVRSVEVVHGKPYDSSWKPVAAPTKNYDDDKEVHSQIVSPLHTSIFGGSQPSSIAPHDISSDFHDFDQLTGNTIHSTYSIHEEEGESKVKPVKAKITSIRKKVTPSSSSTSSESSRLNSRYRKRHNNNAVKTVGLENVADSGASGSHDSPNFVVKAKRNPSKHQHIQSFTTTKPKYTTVIRHTFTDAPKQEVSTESTNKVPYEIPTRLRSKSPSTTTTTIKPSRNVPREVSKYVDKTRASGKRGSIKFGHTTTKRPQ